MLEPIRILIADDHAFYREGVRAMLATMSSAEIVGEAITGDMAVTLATELQPDIILMDVKMPGLNGIEAARAILRVSPHIAILMITMFDDDESVFAAMRAGARGYLLKDARHDEFIRAIAAVAHGEAIFSPTIARRMIQYFSYDRPRALAISFPELTNRELEVLELIARGRNNEAIAAHLSLNLKTIRNHVSNILSKLQVSDRAQAMIKARDAGMGV